MSDQTGKLLIIHKHRIDQKSGKQKRRRFNEQMFLDEMLELAKKYAAENDKDYLIVQVIAEASKPEK